jgi:hypothetical protein
MTLTERTVIVIDEPQQRTMRYTTTRTIIEQLIIDDPFQNATPCWK